MATKAKKTVEVSNVDSLKKIVNGHDFAGRQSIAQKVFSIVCACPINQKTTAPDDVLKADIEKKMEFVERITKNEDSYGENIRDLTRILLSPVNKNFVTKKKVPAIKKKIAKKKAATGKDGKFRSDVLALVLDQTAKSRVGYEYITTKPSENLSPKGREVQEFFDDNGNPFGCQTPVVAQAISAWMKEPIFVEPDDSGEWFNNYTMFGMIEYGGDTHLVVAPDDNENTVHSVDIRNRAERLEGDDHGRVTPSSDEQCEKFVMGMDIKLLRSYFNFLEVL